MRRQTAIIVAHGQPGNPGPQEALLQALAARVALLLPQAQVRAATLAMPGALDAAAADAGRAVVYPFFMAEGWFTGRELPRRLALAGMRDARLCRPLGVDPAMPALCSALAGGAGLEGAGRGTLILAAHGSQRARTSADSARHVAARITGFAEVRTAYVEQEPFLEDVARQVGQGVCLPFFATTADHVTGDLPQALAQAGFRGPLLPPVGAAPQIPGLIAGTIGRALTVS